MNLQLPINLADHYHSKSQKIRVITESWTLNSLFCPNCGNELSDFENNKPVADFYCGNCSEQYELKSKHGSFGTKITDGAYSTMINHLSSERHPNLFLLKYDQPSFQVEDFFAIPKYFFIPNIIEKRKPLADSARRAGWVGCNILLRDIPELGKIYFVKNGVIKKNDEIVRKWNRTAFVRRKDNFESKGWLLDVLVCIEKLKKIDFTLQEIYRFENVLKEKHPDNYHVKAKIRQQLQYL